MKDPRFPKFVVWFNSLVPLALLCFDAWRGNLGANPKEFALHTTGMLALIFLILSLCVTPLRKLTGKNWWSHFRRMLGVYAFFYAALHLAIFFVFYAQGSIAQLITETWKRKYIFYGMSSLILMLPLAITSTNGMIKRLGGKNWKNLHKLVYPAAILAVLHYYALVKADITIPLAFAIVLAVLLGYRVIGYLQSQKPRVVPIRTAG